MRGHGTQADPYIIETEDDLFGSRLCSYTDELIYLVLDRDINVERTQGRSSVRNIIFNGNGHKITMTINKSAVEILYNIANHGTGSTRSVIMSYSIFGCAREECHFYNLITDVTVNINKEELESTYASKGNNLPFMGIDDGIMVSGLCTYMIRDLTKEMISGKITNPHKNIYENNSIKLKVTDNYDIDSTFYDYAYSVVGLIESTRFTGIDGLSQGRISVITNNNVEMYIEGFVGGLNSYIYGLCSGIGETSNNILNIEINLEKFNLMHSCGYNLLNSDKSCNDIIIAKINAKTASGRINDSREIKNGDIRLDLITENTSIFSGWTNAEEYIGESEVINTKVKGNIRASNYIRLGVFKTNKLDIDISIDTHKFIILGKKDYSGNKDCISNSRILLNGYCYELINTSGCFYKSILKTDITLSKLNITKNAEQSCFKGNLKFIDTMYLAFNSCYCYNDYSSEQHDLNSYIKYNINMYDVNNIDTLLFEQTGEKSYIDIEFSSDRLTKLLQAQSVFYRKYLVSSRTLDKFNTQYVTDYNKDYIEITNNKLQNKTYLTDVYLFDFDNIWMITEGYNEGYPHLQFETAELVADALLLYNGKNWLQIPLYDSGDIVFYKDRLTTLYARIDNTKKVGEPNTLCLFPKSRTYDGGVVIKTEKYNIEN